MGARYRYLLALATASAVDVAYFRDDPAAKTQLNVVTGDGAAWLQSHDTTIEIFDSPKPVHVYRVVVTGVPTSTVTLYPAKLGGGLRFPGAAYIFSNATYNCSDAANASAAHRVRYFDGVAWIQAGGAARFDVYIDKAGASMLFFVSSGPLDFSPSAAASAPLRIVAGRDALAASATPYRLTGNCSDGAIHPELPADYSNLDEPIGPLAAHYHTRGALYHVLYGSATFNDPGIADDTLRAGEVRFVNDGVYYGPETMDRSSSFVVSLHEPDPSKVRIVAAAAQDDEFATQCPFACFTNRTATARCVAV